MLGQRRRRWTNIEPASAQRLESEGPSVTAAQQQALTAVGIVGEAG